MTSARFVPGTYCRHRQCRPDRPFGELGEDFDDVIVFEPGQGDRFPTPGHPAGGHFDRHQPVERFLPGQVDGAERPAAERFQ